MGRHTTIIELTDEQLKYVKKMCKAKSTCQTLRSRCQIFLDLDVNHGKQFSCEQCAHSNGISIKTVYTAIQNYATNGLEKALTLNRGEGSNHSRRKVDGRAEANIIKLACGPAPEGHSRWTLRLLADKSRIVLDEPVSKSTIGNVLKKNELRPHKSQYWCIANEEDAEFVACMEDVLDVYERPYDPDYPVICMDEKPYQLLGDAREPKDMKPGKDKKIDSEYVRNGTCSIFAFVEPLAGWHHQSVREHRTAVDWAEEIKWLVDHRPEAKKIVLVMDNLNTHKISSLYKKYDPETARSIRRKLEIHYTPKHGSWLDMAEIELNMMTRQCLNRRIQDISVLRKELSAWETDKNDENKKIVWQFRTEDARVKLISLYPKL